MTPEQVRKGDEKMIGAIIGDIRNAVSIGGDSDTLAAITGGIAGAYYGVPAAIRKQALKFLDERLRKILTGFESAYSPALNKEKKSIYT
jgi:type I restriction enzyme M protein